MNISLLINGADRAASGGRTYDRIDPFTEKLASRAAAAARMMLPRQSMLPAPPSAPGRRPALASAARS